MKPRFAPGWWIIPAAALGAALGAAFWIAAASAAFSAPEGFTFTIWDFLALHAPGFAVIAAILVAVAVAWLAADSFTKGE